MIFRKYLKNIFKKKWIYLFKNPVDIFIFFISKKDNKFKLYINYRNFNNIIIKNIYFFLFSRLKGGWNLWDPYPTGAGLIALIKDVNGLIRNPTRLLQ